MLNRLALVFIVLFLLVSCTPSPRYTIEKKKKTTKEQTSTKIPAGKTVKKPPKGKKINGIASYYGKDFHGRKTANGEIFDMYGLTAAHKTLPFNTWLEVKNLSNEKTVIVRVNDRGPFVAGRIIDLSYGAAKVIQMVGAGVQEVELTVLR